MSELPRIGFVGFGAMGKRMAMNLRRAEYGIVACAPSREPGSHLDGIRFLSNAAEIARESDIVLLTLPNDQVLERAVKGENGLIAGLRDKQLVINTSTVSPDASRKLLDAVKTKGASALDAPVSGSTPEAEAGELVILVGGEVRDVERATPIFDVIGKKAYHVGPAGMGSTIKLVVNGIMGQTLAGIAETIGYGIAAGLDRQTLFDTLDGMAVISPHHKRKIGTAAEQRYAPQFPTALMHKDLSLLVNDAGRYGIPLGSVAAAQQLYAAARSDYDSDDYSAAIRLMEDFVSRRFED